MSPVEYRHSLVLFYADNQICPYFYLLLYLIISVHNNMALISRGYPKNIKRKNDILVSLFNELLEFDNRLKKYIPPLTEKIILKVIKSVGMRVRSKEITEFIMNGYNQIVSRNNIFT